MSLQRQSYFSVSGFRVPIRNTADYSPFGVQLDGRTIQGDFYRRGFNGMEKDDEVKGGGNSYDFGARMYDARVGRFLSLDNFKRKFASQSPYLFGGNTPLCAIDSNGDSVYIVINGNVFSHDSKEGKAQLSLMGYDKLVSTRSGRRLMNYYETNSNFDVYITIGDPGNPTAGAGTMSHFWPKGSTKIDKNMFGKDDSFNNFNNMNIKNPKNGFAVVVFNEKYIKREGIFAIFDIYDRAESLFHELKCHINLKNQAINNVKKSKENNGIPLEQGAEEHKLYGVEHHDNMGINQTRSLRQNSVAVKIRQELQVLRKKETGSEQAAPKN